MPILTPDELQAIATDYDEAAAMLRLLGQRYAGRNLADAEAKANKYTAAASYLRDRINGPDDDPAM